MNFGFKGRWRPHRQRVHSGDTKQGICSSAFLLMWGGQWAKRDNNKQHLLSAMIHVTAETRLCKSTKAIYQSRPKCVCGGRQDK